MNKKHIMWGAVFLSLAFTPSCRRSTDEVVNDTRTATRHMKRGVSALGGKHNDSRQILSRDELYGSREPFFQEDFIPLSDIEFSNVGTFAAEGIPQPRNNPGDPGSPIPGIEAFFDPRSTPETERVFKNIYFDYDSNIIRGDENFSIVRRIANYLKNHPDSYAFVEGHCDERGGEAYNLALGAKRSNAIRAYLIQEGVNPDHVFTISYGRERPVALGHYEDAWAQNRRAEFKVYFPR